MATSAIFFLPKLGIKILAKLMKTSFKLFLIMPLRIVGFIGLFPLRLPLIFIRYFLSLFFGFFRRKKKRGKVRRAEIGKEMRREDMKFRELFKYRKKRYIFCTPIVGKEREMEEMELQTFVSKPRAHKGKIQKHQPHKTQKCKSRIYPLFPSFNEESRTQNRHTFTPMSKNISYIPVRSTPSLPIDPKRRFVVRANSNVKKYTQGELVNLVECRRPMGEDSISYKKNSLRATIHIPYNNNRKSMNKQGNNLLYGYTQTQNSRRSSRGENLDEEEEAEEENKHRRIQRTTLPLLIALKKILLVREAEFLFKTKLIFPATFIRQISIDYSKKVYTQQELINYFLEKEEGEREGEEMQGRGRWKKRSRESERERSYRSYRSFMPGNSSYSGSDLVSEDFEWAYPDPDSSEGEIYAEQLGAACSSLIIHNTAKDAHGDSAFMIQALLIEEQKVAEDNHIFEMPTTGGTLSMDNQGIDAHLHNGEMCTSSTPTTSEPLFTTTHNSDP